MAICIYRKKDHPKLYLWAKNWEKTNIPQIDIEPVPVMEIIKSGTDSVDTSSEILKCTEIKVETKSCTKDEPDEKSIASDSELMKILEEDSIQSEETRAACKKEDTMNSKDSHILLNALTSGGSSDTKQKNVTFDVKKEDDGKQDIKKNTLNNDHLQIAYYIV